MRLVKPLYTEFGHFFRTVDSQSILIYFSTEPLRLILGRFVVPQLYRLSCCFLRFRTALAMLSAPKKRQALDSFFCVLSALQEHCSPRWIHTSSRGFRGLSLVSNSQIQHRMYIFWRPRNALPGTTLWKAVISIFGRCQSQ